MIPYIHSTTYTVFGLTIQTWGTFVAAGFALGTYVAWRWARSKHLDPNAILDLAFWIFISAFVGARLLHVLFYEPGYYVHHLLEAVDPRQPGFSMFGGLIGAAVATFIYVKRHALNFIQYADTLVWGLPWGCGVGRIGCFLIHDHPGTLTHFVLAVKYPDGSVRHDLGLYLSIIGFLTGGLFLFLNYFFSRGPSTSSGRPRQTAAGFWLGAYLLIESIVRLSSDFLRVVDTRYFGLTPTQWLAIPLFAVSVWLIRGSKRFIHSKGD